MDASGLLAAVRTRRSATAADAAMALALYPASELENRRQLATLAAPAISDPAVASAWLACAISESDSAQREAMIGRLLALAPGQLPEADHAAWVDLLLASLDREAIRHGAIAALRAFAASTPGLADRLVAAAAAAGDATVRDHLDDVILGLVQPTPAVAAHWRARLRGSGLAVRLRLAARLLDHGLLDDADAARFLAPGEPVAVRELVLRAWFDRGRGPVDALATVLAHDPDAGCRLLALDLLAATGGREAVGVQAVVDAARHDAEPRLRARAALVLAGWPDADGSHLSGILDQLRGERDRHAFTATVQVLGPILARIPTLRAGLAGLLSPQLDADGAAAVANALAPYARSDAALRDALLDACERLTHDRVRAAVLAALAGILAPDPALEPSFRRALASAAPALRSWGAQGFLRLDILAVDPATATAAATALGQLPAGGGYEANQLRRRLARKLAVLRPLPAVFATLADNDSDDEMRELATQAVRAAASASAGEKPFDWADALERIQARHDAAGLFPEVFERAAQDRIAAGPVLHATALALLTTGLDHAPCDFHGLLPHLVLCDVLDEALVRAIAQRLRAEPKGREDPSPDLAVLRAAPRLPEVLSALEAVLPHARRVSPGLIRDLVTEAHGGDRPAAVAWLHARLLAVSDPSTAEELLNLLEKGEEWIQPDAVLQAWHATFVAKPGSDRLLRSLTALCKRWNIALAAAPAAAPAPSAREGGLLDD